MSNMYSFNVLKSDPMNNILCIFIRTLQREFKLLNIKWNITYNNNNYAISPNTQYIGLRFKSRAVQLLGSVFGMVQTVNLSFFYLIRVCKDHF